MKLTIFNTLEHSPWGGSEELWYSVAKLALLQGNKVQLCLINWETDTHFKIKELQELGASVIWRERLKSLKDVVMQKVKAKLKTPEKYVRQIEAFDPDALLVSQPGSFDYFFHTQLVNFTNSSAFPYFLISQFNTENGGILPSDIVSSINTARPWNRFYFVAQRNLEVASRQAGIYFQNTKVTDNSMNIIKVEVSAWPKEIETLQMACVARLECAFKGQDVLLETLSDKIFSHQNYKLRFFGAGPDKEHLQRLITLYGLQDKVEIMGHVKDIDEIWSKHHIMIMPSIAEGTPLALREAMLKGRPALSTDVGGCATLVKDMETGFLIPVCAKEYLKQGLIRVFETPIPRLERMGANAFTHVMSIVDLKCIENLLVDVTSAVK